MKIPKIVMIELHAVEQAALEALASEAGAEDSTIEDLLNLVVTAGLMKLLIGREVPEVEGSLAAQCERLAPGRMKPGTGPSKSADFMALALDLAQVHAFDDLANAYPLLNQNEIGRIVVNLGLEAAQRQLPDAMAGGVE
jgi:hypothetical protein